MIDYKTLKQDKNGIPVRQMYYGIVLKVAIKEKEIKYYYQNEKSKPISKTKIYSIYDESNKLLFQTTDYIKLREHLRNLWWL